MNSKKYGNQKYEKQEPQDGTFQYGKHKDETFSHVYETDNQYAIWAMNNFPDHYKAVKYFKHIEAKKAKEECSLDLGTKSDSNAE